MSLGLSTITRPPYLRFVAYALILILGCGNKCPCPHLAMASPLGSKESLAHRVVHCAGGWRNALSFLARVVPQNGHVSRRLVALRGGDDSAQALNDLACRLMASGGQADVHRAEDSLRRALAMQPSNAAALCNYGRLLLRQDRDLALAGDMMAKAVRLQPEPAIYSSYALYLEDGVHDYVRAQEVYESALLLHPSDTVLLHNLAQLLRSRSGESGGREGRLADGSVGGQRGSTSKRNAQQTWDLGRAKSLFERVLSLQPNAVESLNGLGCLLLDTSKLADARKVRVQVRQSASVRAEKGAKAARV